MNDSAGFFRGTAPSYARYRRPYPPEVVAYLVDTFNLDGRGRLLDAGCGTGQVFVVLANLFEGVVAFDQDAEMVAIARQTAARNNLANVDVLEMRAEEIGPQLGPFRLAVFGASFHWMDRQRVADLVYGRLESEGAIVAIAPSNPYSGNDPLADAIQETVRDFLGPERRAGDGVYIPGERHAAALAKTRFGAPTTVDVLVREDWTIDEIVGWMDSTSFANRRLLGGQADAFEESLTRRLRPLAADGIFKRRVTYTVIWARKP